VTKIEWPDARHGNDDDDDGLDWSNFQGKKLPIVHFAGTSRSLHASWDPNANSKIRGEYDVLCCVVETKLLKLMWNEVLFDKLQKARYDGRHSPSSTAKNGGDLRACKSVGCAQPEAYWGTGSISKERFGIPCW
jgi:hypothetical protein